VTGVARRFGSIAALKGVDLRVEPGELVTLLGPSGSGKTTLLKLIAGFDSPDAGTIVLSGRDITWAPPAARNIGMVFQNYALFPHLTVARNIAFPLQMRRMPQAEIARRVQDVLRMIGLADYGDRLPKALSGGQQQRVALARAIVFDPGLLLLDEPFGALDRKLREQMQLEVRRLQRRLRLTTIFVTHDQEEALVLSDRIVVMNDGRIIQVDTPTRLYRSPSCRFVADFLGESNLFRGQCREDGTIVLGGGTVLRGPVANGHAPGTAVEVLLRPERLRPLVPGESAENRFSAEVIEVIYLGNASKYRLRLDDGLQLTVRWPGDANRDALAPGARLDVGWDRADLQILAPE
jgi:spermidine/putrescine ABC transporter ATP-binding subunit